MTLLPKVKLKAVVNFPATVRDGTGIDVVKSNGTYRLDLDYGDFAPPIDALPDLTNQNILLWNETNGQYTLSPVGFLRDSLSVTHFGAIANGALSGGGAVTGFDNTAAFNAAYIVAAARGCDLRVPAGTYAIYGQIAGQSSVILRGEGHIPPFGGGSTLLNGQTGGAPVPMFLFPPASYGWGFEEIRIEGNNVSAAAVSVSESSGAFGSYNVSFNKTSFHECRPAIYAEYSFDWWIRNCGFINCGDIAGAGATVATIVARNSNFAIVGGASNTWHILDNFIETRTGLGILLDGSGLGDRNSAMFISSNHFEGIVGQSGHEMIKVIGGCNSCLISDNFFLGTSASVPLIDLGTSGNYNIITSNSFNGAGFYDTVPVLGHAIKDGNFSDLIANNIFTSGVGALPAVNLILGSGACVVCDNIVIPATVNIVLDAGSTNTVRNNIDASQVVINRSQPVKLAGTQLWEPLAPFNNVTAYTPTLTVSSGTLTSATATGTHYKIGRMVYVWGVISITTNGTAAGLLSASLPSQASLAAAFSTGNTTTGVGGWGEVDAATSTVGLRTSAGAYPGANATTLYFTGNYVEA